MEVHRLDRRIAGIINDNDPLGRIRLCRNGVQTTGERLGRIVAEHKGHDPAPATVFHRPPIVDRFGIMQAGQDADAIGPSPFRAPGQIRWWCPQRLRIVVDPGCPRYGSFQPAVWATTGAGTNVTEA